MNVSIGMGRVAAAIAFAVAVLGGVASSSPALANDGTCGGHDLCLWEGGNLTGGRWDSYGSVNNFASGERWWGTSISVNDSASSVKNRDDNAAGLCRHSFQRGGCVTIGAFFEIRHLADYEMDNQASSNYTMA